MLLLKIRYLFCISIIIFFVFIHSSFAQIKNTTLGAGYTFQYNFLLSDYGVFLKEYYGINRIIFSGPTLFLSKEKTEKLDVGIEMNYLVASFKYENLNQQENKNEFELLNLIGFIHYEMTPSFFFKAGLGTSSLSRSLHGYKNNDILAKNVEQNSGQQTSDTWGFLTFGEILYKISESKKSLYVYMSARYSINMHYIPDASNRPGLDAKGRPQNMIFDAGGLALILSFKKSF